MSSTSGAHDLSVPSFVIILDSYGEKVWYQCPVENWVLHISTLHVKQLWLFMLFSIYCRHNPHWLMHRSQVSRELWTHSFTGSTKKPRRAHKKHHRKLERGKCWGWGKNWGRAISFSKQTCHMYVWNL